MSMVFRILTRIKGAIVDLDELLFVSGWLHPRYRYQFYRYCTAYRSVVCNKRFLMIFSNLIFEKLYFPLVMSFRFLRGRKAILVLDTITIE